MTALSDKGPVAVTGGTGFVGSHLVEHLLARGYTDIRCLVRRNPGWLEGLPVVRIPGDMNDVEALERLLSGAEQVFHVAAVTRARSWKDMHRANVEGTENLLRAATKACPHVQRIILTSSLAAVGRADVAVPDESAPLRPVSMYGRSKMEMERVAEPYVDRLPVTIIRPPAVYGPRETDIFSFIQILSRGLCPIVGRGTEPSLSLVHVSDLAAGMVGAAESDASTGKCWFMGSAEVFSWHEIRDAVRQALGRRVVTLHIPRSVVPVVGALSEWVGRLMGTYPPLNRDKAREILHAATMCSSERAMQHLGYRPGVSLSDGMHMTVEWYRKKGWLPS
ncbi:MAG: NAD-dependent epimerase [Bacteroidetes bacterium CG12_big_fil_rev_8_21_14_0_65_60_17]|nr:MAG: NAD-dependent epimerase [Bacteroidetes bacterium CG12_big_fil_rev_8_21_14_0_65_60_17]